MVHDEAARVRVGGNEIIRLVRRKHTYRIFRVMILGNFGNPNDSTPMFRECEKGVESRV